MNIPGFTADTSLATTRGRYRAAGRRALAGAGAVMPQLPRQLKLLMCLENCSAAGASDFCRDLCFFNDFVNTGDDLFGGGGPGGGGGGGGQKCQPHCMPCRADANSDTGRSRTCVKRNCDVNTVDC